MRKLIIIIIILTLGVAAIWFFIQKKNAGTESMERGEIKDISVAEAEEDDSIAYDDEAYKKLSSYAYKGEVNYHDLIFVFKPKDYVTESTSNMYECAVLEDDDNPYTEVTIYAVDLNKKGELNMSYVNGPYESVFDCLYKDGELVINEVKMEKFDLDEINDFVYIYGGAEEEAIRERGGAEL